MEVEVLVMSLYARHQEKCTNIVRPLQALGSCSFPAICPTHVLKTVIPYSSEVKLGVAPAE